MRAFIESLKRLYACNRITLADINRQLENKKISEDEYEYIITVTDDSSLNTREGDYNG